MLTENVYINNRLEPTATTTTKLTHLRTFMVYYILRSIEFIAIQTIYLEERYRLTPYFPFFGSTSAVNCSRCVLSLSLFFSLSHVLALSLAIKIVTIVSFILTLLLFHSFYLSADLAAPLLHSPNRHIKYAEKQMLSANRFMDYMRLLCVIEMPWETFETIAYDWGHFSWVKNSNDNSSFVKCAIKIIRNPRNVDSHKQKMNIDFKSYGPLGNVFIFFVHQQNFNTKRSSFFS